jgi:photosystem II stability/assembly factor-like uncharacterized protein
VGLLLPGLVAQAQSSRAMREDAWLRSVWFVDVQTGWAVGDRGVIWHTNDGGRTWQLQESGVDCSLYSVHFLDARRGWAVGARCESLLHHTTGVVLRTLDGGATWAEESRGQLPGLRRVKFFSAANGWALGEPSGLFPSGLFVTENGGRSWNALPGATSQGWLTGDLVDPLTGGLAGRQGQVAVVRRKALEPGRVPPFGLRGLHAMQLEPLGTGWLVGDGGLALATRDLGGTWQLPGPTFPVQTALHFDFHALFSLGPQTWIAGTPGTRVFYTPDGGQSWELCSTDQALPLHGLHFADERHGWAVGACGTILATADGGRSWRRQHSGGTRAALLCVVGDAQNLPLELLTDVCGNDGYLGAALIVGRGDVAPAPDARQTQADRAHQAMILTGGSGAETAWRFPLNQPGITLDSQKLVQDWDRASDDSALLRLEELCVRQIRCWRPDVVVTHAASAQGADPLGHVVNQVVLRAIDSAADATRFTEQTVDAGLIPWQVKKVFGALRPGEKGTVNLNVAELAPHFGRSLAEVAGQARTLLQPRLVETSTTLGFRLSINHLPHEIGQVGIMSGLNLQRGGEARRALDSLSEGIEALHRTAQQFRNAQVLIEQAERGAQGSPRLLGELSDLTRGMDGAQAGQLWYQLAQRYHRTGRAELAAETFDLLVQRYPNHPLAASAGVWLLHYWSSGEAAWRSRRQQQVIAQQASAVVDASGGKVPATPAVSRFKGRQGTMLVAVETEDRPARAVQIGQWLERTHPALHAEPQVRFPLAVAQLGAGLARQAERSFLLMRRMRPRDAWWQCAEAESWFADRRDLPPKSAARCLWTGEKPYLDGKLGDPVWQAAMPIELRSRLRDDESWPATALLAHDGEFLYLAVRCRKAAGVEYAPLEKGRTRDPDVSRRDRVELLIDLDRDYATYYQLVVDQAGQVADGCWGDPTWNPAWHVANHQDGLEWTCEAALPLHELTGTVPSADTAWAIGIQRTVPGVGFQSWSLPASTLVQPEGFGLLLFEGPPGQ